MKIGIICAVAAELAPFLPHIINCKTSTKSMLTVYEGTINGTEIAALCCGIGTTNAAIATQILIDTYGAGAIINSGTAGGMDARLELFDTVVCTGAVYHDVQEAILTAFHPKLPSIHFKACETLIKKSKNVKTNGKICYGSLVTGNKFIDDDGRDEINAKFEPLAVDMETASIAHVCYVNNVPYVAVRTITDTANHSGVGTFEENCPKASQISKDIVLGMLD